MLGTISGPLKRRDYILNGSIGLWGCFWVLICCLCSVNLAAQYNIPEGRVWALGTNAGVDFNSTNPAAIKTALNNLNSTTKEGCASVCNSAGKLLFYTNGQYIWNRNNTLMPNGNLGINTNSCTQATVIVPLPGNDSGKYIVFSLEPKDGTQAQRLFYSVVDMVSDNGLGDVDPNKKKVLLHAERLQEKMTVIPGTRCNLWLIVKTDVTNYFKAYDITSDGVKTSPVLSSLGANPLLPMSSFTEGMLKSSEDGTKLYESTKMANNGLIESFDFDRNTGKMSNRAVIDQSSTDGYYSICLSPDNSKLYTGTAYAPGRLYQFDLSLATPAAIIASRTLIYSLGNDLGPGDIKNGPDGKLYFSKPTHNYLHAINAPNLAGTACQLALNAVQLLAGSQAEIGLPNVNVKRPVPDKDTLFTPWLDTMACGNPVSIKVRPGREIFNIIWNDGFSGSERELTKAGKYWVTFIMDCRFHQDTFTVRDQSGFMDLGKDTIACHPFDLIPFTVHDIKTFTWQDGTVADRYPVKTSGIYKATVTVEGCSVSDSVYVQLVDMKQELGKDTAICSKETFAIQLKANVPQGGSALWNTSGTDSYLWATDFGVYRVIVSHPACPSATDSITISSLLCDCSVLVPNAFSPNNDGTNDIFKAETTPGCEINGYQMRIFNRWGQCVFSTNQSTVGWDGIYNAKPVEAGTYFYEVKLEKGLDHKKLYQKGDLVLIR